MRVTYVNVRARHLLKKSMVRAPKNMAAIVTAIVMNLPGMTLQPLYTTYDTLLVLKATAHATVGYRGVVLAPALYTQ